jgi:hypothetical protein
VSIDERDVLDIDVDQVWLREWTQAGLAELESYLAKHAAFLAYLDGETAAST